MARDDAQLKFRVPDDLKEHLQRIAARNMRSLNAEIIARLEASRDADSKRAVRRLLETDDALDVRMDALEKRMAKLEKDCGK
jgi:ubiquinone biosynthesis protein UbiJ